MGVEASLSVSILKRGKLWWLFACHHRSPIVLPYSTRTAAELFGQLFSFVLEQKESDLEHEERRVAQEMHHQLMARIGDGGSVADYFDTILDTIGTVISFDGAAGWIGGEFMARGSAPTHGECADLARFLNTSKPNQIFSTDEIAMRYPAAESFGAQTVGLLALPVSISPRDYIVLFRREIARQVVWAGNPNKPAQLGPNGVRLTPRKSFEAWQEVVLGRSAPWSRLEIAAADALRVTLLEAVLKLTDEALTARSKANDRQELLIAELNHRVRNILNLVRGLISQSEGEARSAQELTEVISGRIHSLARAHDQITQGGAFSQSFHELLEVEGEAYLGDGGQNIDLKGPNAALDSHAFSTLALVMHELMTNAVKYGALSGEAGRVTITTARTADGSYEINWSEEGGPSIQPGETKRGFGSTLIERSIPHDLDGEADLRLETSGLEARFVIPASFVSDASKHVAKKVQAHHDGATPNPALLANILVVEDNMIIALDVEDMLSDASARRVSIASSTRDALAIVDARRPSFALLDVNLLAETSEAVAAKLSELGVPFAFATGYGENTDLAQRFPKARTLTKPFGRKALLSVLSD